ncbi:MAG TPA: aconitase X [Smithellaceae bacterium]|mgnify:FL=1|nr:aconitase X [Smithellaceae bacterium]HNT91211.1 aconitase X [Smithellaceae bacterium]HNV64574.1 aconitase X [Smithellaceae bacterium]HOF76882.1 aconitase X [Smithellaceae bacterium]HOM69666.1 aconitase X [Smithellaceae bacterium]
MQKYSLQLTDEEKEILAGKQGEAMRKALESVVLYGQIFGAEHLAPIGGSVHLVTSFGIPLLKPVFSLVDELIAAGLKTAKPFTVDPRPMDFQNVPVNILEKFIFKKIMYGKQAQYEEQLRKVGLKDDKSFTCTCYMDEVGNIPRKGQILAWAESSAVVYANSVLGARTNRNSGLLELLCGITGRAPVFGLLTDEGRKADWLIEVKTKSLPEAQILGSAIGMKVMEEVPFVSGLTSFLGEELNQRVKDYLKDMGAAAASNGAVGLYHIEDLTPEALELSRGLLKSGYKTYVIDDAELKRVRDSYPLMWKNPAARPKVCFIGCPHLSLRQIYEWLEHFETELKSSGKKKLAVTTIMTAAPAVADAFRNDKVSYSRLTGIGARLTSICPLMYMNNPLCAKKAVMTNSNKLRTYTTARYFTDAETARIAVEGGIYG